MLAYGMHHHTITKFGSKRFSSSGDSFWTNINWNFEPLLWPRHWTQEANIFTRYSDHLPSALTCIYHQAIFGCKIIFSSEGIIILLYFSTCHDFGLKGSISVFLHDSLSHIWCNTKLSLLTKGQAVRMRTSRQSLDTWRETSGQVDMLILTYPPAIPPTLLRQVQGNSADTLQMNCVCIQKDTVAGLSPSKCTYIVAEVCF